MTAVTGHHTLPTATKDPYKPPFADQAQKKKFKEKALLHLRDLNDSRNLSQISAPRNRGDFKRWVFDVREQVIFKAIQEASDGILEKLLLKIAQHFSLFADTIPLIYRIKEKVFDYFGFIQEKVSAPSLNKLTPGKRNQIPQLVLAKGVLENYVLGMQDANWGNVVIDGDPQRPETWNVKFIDNVRSLAPSDDLIWFIQGKRFFTQPALRFGLLGVPKTKEPMTEEECKQIRKWIETMEQELPALKTYLESPKVKQKTTEVPLRIFPAQIYKNIEERIKKLKQATEALPQFSLRELICKANPAYKRHVGMEAARYFQKLIQTPENTLSVRHKDLTPVDFAFGNAGKNTLLNLYETMPKSCNLAKVNEFAQMNQLLLPEYFEKIRSYMAQDCINDRKDDSAYFCDSIYRAVPFTADHTLAQAKANLRNFFLAQMNLKPIDVKETPQIPPLELFLVEKADGFHFYFKDSSEKLYSVKLDHTSHLGQVEILNKAGPFIQNSILTTKDIQQQFLCWAQLLKAGFTEMMAEDSNLPQLGFKFEATSAQALPLLKLYFQHQMNCFEFAVDYWSLFNKIILLDKNNKITTLLDLKNSFYADLAKSRSFQVNK